MNASHEKPLAFVIEDDPKQGDVFSRAVQMAGYQAEIIPDGKQALSRLAEAVPALVVLDLHLPSVPGDEILHHIRADERLKDVPVILATADPRMAEPLHDESDLVLLKPVSFIQLRDLAARLCQQG
ncbi:MAG: response regulator [Chloroflexi bacterium]|nr:response regulator [Chloroflexota bacterium]